VMWKSNFAEVNFGIQVYAGFANSHL
jgi:hypothetical protein